MSASNWAVCPKCLATAKAQQLAMAEEAKAAYGKVTLEEWILLDAQGRDVPDPENYRTFREDYEFYGVTTGTLKISYGGSCGVCGLEVEYQHRIQVWPEAL